MPSFSQSTCVHCDPSVTIRHCSHLLCLCLHSPIKADSPYTPAAGPALQTPKPSKLEILWGWPWAQFSGMTPELAFSLLVWRVSMSQALIHSHWSSHELQGRRQMPATWTRSQSGSGTPRKHVDSASPWSALSQLCQRQPPPLQTFSQAEKHGTTVGFKNSPCI